MGSWAYLALGAALVAVEWARQGWPYPASDDPYIYLGYVKRVLTSPHELFSYNPGEHSAGTTGLLYYYLLIPVCALLRPMLFFLPLERVLLLGLWLTNVYLFALAGGRFRKAARALGVPRAPTADAALFLLFCAHPKFLWGAWSGLENPLAALLALVVVERLLNRAPVWHTALAAAALVATRPETLSVLWIAPLAAALSRPAAPAATEVPGAIGAGLARRLAGAVAVWVGTLTVLVLPCRLLTGRIFPSSLGTRVHLAPLAEPGVLAASLARAAEQTAYWSSEWVLFAVAQTVLAAVLLRRGRGVLVGTGLVLLLFFAARGLFGLFDFSVEDRYVSWIWPLFALVLATAGAPILGRLARRGAPVAVALLAVSLLPLGEFLRRFEHHVELMDRIVVRPARWMRANLPEGSRICMEPAGAIRVFTDFYLVDAKGLTTTHRHGYRGDYVGFLFRNGIDYVFDRDDPGRQLVEAGAGRELGTWARGVEPWGDIRLFEAGPSRNAVIRALAASGAARGSDPAAAFDNLARTAPGPAWAPTSSPAWIDVELAGPVPVEAVDVVVRAGSAEARPRVSASLRGTPAPPGDAAVPREVVGAPRSELLATRHGWGGARVIDHLRVEWTGEGPTEVVEIVALRPGGIYRWLDGRGADGFDF